MLRAVDAISPSAGAEQAHNGAHLHLHRAAGQEGVSEEAERARYLSQPQKYKKHPIFSMPC